MITADGQLMPGGTPEDFAANEQRPTPNPPQEETRMTTPGTDTLTVNGQEIARATLERAYARLRELLGAADGPGSVPLSQEELSAAWTEVAGWGSYETGAALRDMALALTGHEGNSTFATMDEQTLALAALVDDVVSEEYGAAFDPDFGMDESSAALEVQRFALLYPGMIDTDKAMAASLTAAEPDRATRPYVAPTAAQDDESERLARLSLTGPVQYGSASDAPRIASDGLQLTAEQATDEIDRLVILSRKGQKHRADLEHDLDETENASTAHDEEIDRLLAYARSKGLMTDLGNREGKAHPPGPVGQRTTDYGQNHRAPLRGPRGTSVRTRGHRDGHYAGYPGEQGASGGLDAGGGNGGAAQ